MASKALYILGNGFDLYHGLPTRYVDFKNFLETQLQLYEQGLVKTNLEYGYAFLDKICASKDLWSQFEKELGNPDVSMIFKMSQLERRRLPQDAPLDYAWENICDQIKSEVQDLFSRWIDSLEITIEKKLRIPPDARFLVFNYTHLLEGFYDIPKELICYIHDDSESYEPTISSDIINVRNYVVGCDFNQRCECLSKCESPDHSKIVEIYFDRMSKNVKEIMASKKWVNFTFNIGHDEISQIYILGHSVEPVDQPYFINISDHLPKAQWFYAERNGIPESDLLSNLHKIGINATPISYDAMSL